MKFRKLVAVVAGCAAAVTLASAPVVSAQGDDRSNRQDHVTRKTVLADPQPVKNPQRVLDKDAFFTPIEP